MTALARHSDPSTSHEAAASIAVSHLEGIVLDMLRRYSFGATSFELAEALGMSLVTVSPRLKPLVDKGLVFDTGFRVRGESGRNQTIWRAVQS